VLYRSEHPLLDLTVPTQCLKGRSQRLAWQGDWQQRASGDQTESKGLPLGQRVIQVRRIEPGGRLESRAGQQS